MPSVVQKYQFYNNYCIYLKNQVLVKRYNMIKIKNIIKITMTSKTYRVVFILNREDIIGLTIN